jgi:hypothetical protein
MIAKLRTVLTNDWFVIDCDQWLLNVPGVGFKMSLWCDYTHIISAHEIKSAKYAYQDPTKLVL